MSRFLRLGSSSLAVVSRLGPCLDRLLSLIADCDPTILSCSRLSFSRGRSRRSPRPKVAFSYSNCGAVSDFVDQLKGVVGSIPCWLFLGSCEEHDGEKVTGLVACTQTFSVLICSEMFRRTALATSSTGMIIECQCQQFFSRLYLLGFTLWCSSFLSAAARQAAAHLPHFCVFLVRLQYSGMGC